MKDVRKILALLLAVVLVLGCFAACGNNAPASSTASEAAPASSSEAAPAESTESTETPTEEPTTTGSTGPDDTSTHESFTVYYNYGAWTHPFGEDEYSAFLAEKFNVDMSWSAGENDPDAKLNLMMSSGDMPHMIITERGAVHNKVARAGMLVDLATVMYDGCSFAESIPESVRNMLKVDGVLYGMPNWARKGATGGNYQWMVARSAYEQLGSPEFNTLTDIHDYAVAAKEANLTSYNGGSVYPFLCSNTENGYYVYWPMFRALGGRELNDSYWTQENDKIEFGVDNEKFVEALKMANSWYNEGLFSQEVFTDSSEQFLEKVTNGRAALLWYDFSQDSVNRFNQIVGEQSGGAERYLVWGFDMGKDKMMFPGVEGVDVTYGDAAGGIGWNVNCITTTCPNPQRMFDVFSFMLTPEGSLLLQYGPEGGTMLDHIDWSGDLPAPVLKKNITEFSTEEQNTAGAWFWSQPAQSDYVDGIKFAYNDSLPEDQRDWVISIQAHLCSYDAENPRIGQKFMTDQLTNVTGTIDPQDDLGICLKAIEDQCKEQLPKIIMASSEDEFNSLVKALSDFAHSQRVDEINSTWQAKYEENIATQGFNAYSAEYDVYKLNK